jgi:hypothetical protein
MSYITTDNLTNIMAEMTDYCNAACPMCNRFDWDFFKDISEGIGGGEKRLQGCYHACGIK